MTAAEICAHRLSIITGHYGTGKTELSVNLALSLASGGERVILADLDIVNPYFRSRERRQLLEESGVRLIATSQACTAADVPSIPAELLAVLEDRTARGVLDTGGDPGGARVLARFQPKIVGDSMGVPPLMTLFLLYIGFKARGIAGMILAVPVGLLFINFYKYGAFDGLIENARALWREIERFRRS